MNCEPFESMMADALGDELSPDDRTVFEAHLAGCDQCRHEYETRLQTIKSLRDLPGPQRVTIQRRGNRLVIQGLPESPPEVMRVRYRGVLRYAAGLLIAFTAGYATHLGMMMGEDGSVTSSLSPVADHQGSEKMNFASAQVERDTLQSSLVNVHFRRPGRSDLAKCMIAMLVPRP